MKKFNEKIQELYESIEAQKINEAKKSIGLKVLKKLDDIDPSALVSLNLADKLNTKTRENALEFYWFKSDSSATESKTRRLVHNETYDISESDYDYWNRPKTRRAENFDDMAMRILSLTSYMEYWDICELIYKAKMRLLTYA